MRKFVCLVIIAVFASCGSKRTQNQLTSGNYDEAISTAANNLRNNKDKKGKQDFIYMIEEAFAKAKERDLREVELLAKDANPNNLEKLYNTYQRLNNRQEIIRPLLPLKLIKENRNAIFPFENYSDEIISSKNALSAYLYTNAVKQLKTANKLEARKVYDDLQYLNQINPGFKDVQKLIEEAQFNGTDFVNVTVINETNMIIPARLEYDLLDFSTFGLSDKWTEYHSNRQQGISYNFGIVLNFRNILVSPERITERQFTVERDINLGKKKLLDRNGQVVNDSLGNPVMVDNIRGVNAKITEWRQIKSCQITAKVDYVDLSKDQLLQTFPIASEFIFENIYAKIKGDRRAVDENYLPNLDRRPMPFPSSEQMVYDTGEDLKAKLKGIITKNHIRR